MDLVSALALAGAGFAAGTVNVVVGSGTLITFPTLLALGYSPLVANVSNTIGLVPGSLSGVHAYRGELSSGQQRRRAAFSRHLDDLEPILTRNGNDTRSLVKPFDAKRSAFSCQNRPHPPARRMRLCWS